MKEVDCAEVGTVKKDSIMLVKGLDGKQAVHADLDELRKRWKSTLGA
jgi:hypothetical protein